MTDDLKATRTGGGPGKPLSPFNPAGPGGFFQGLMDSPGAGELEPYLPVEDLVGGSVPYAAGLEDEAVWNAAAQACGTERVHYCYTVEEGRCWYLATPSSALASNPHSWCPLAAALPGNSEYWDRQTVYLYEKDGAAGVVKWDNETGRMQVFLGASRTLLPRIQSMEANFVTIKPEAAKPVPWKSRALERERLSRALVRTLFFSGLAVTAFSILIWVGAYTVAAALTPKLDKARAASAAASEQLMVEASNALFSNTDQVLARMIDLLNKLSGFGGVLTRFEVKADGKIEWEGLVPTAVQPAQLQAVAEGTEGGRAKIKGSN